MVFYRICAIYEYVLVFYKLTLKVMIFFSHTKIKRDSYLKFEISLILCQKCQPLKIASTNQIEPSIKSYEHFKF